MNQLLAVHNANRAELNRRLSLVNNQLVFVCGALRSGTSLLHLMLNAHPGIDNPGEFDFLFDKINESGEPPELKDYYDWLHNHRIFNSKKINISDEFQTYSEVTSSFVEQVATRENVLALNVHRHFHKIHKWFPTAKYIHLIRDPRDVARSSIGMGWAGNVYYGVDHWIETERSWAKLKPKLSENQYIEIYFEDLIFDPQTILKKICEFCNVPYADSMLNYHENSTYEKPDVNLIYQWKRKLTKNEVQQVESKVSDVLVSLKYEPSNYGDFSNSLIQKAYLKFQNKLYKLKFSIKRYGLALVIRERISRWFNLNNQSIIVRRQMNEIDRSVIK